VLTLDKNSTQDSCSINVFAPSIVSFKIHRALHPLGAFKTSSSEVVLKKNKQAQNIPHRKQFKHSCADDGVQSSQSNSNFCWQNSRTGSSAKRKIREEKQL